MDLISRFALHEDFHQSVAYAKVMESIGWVSIPMAGSYLFVRSLGPISFAKFQRPRAINFRALQALIKKLHIVSLVIEPAIVIELIGNSEGSKTLHLLEKNDLSGYLGELQSFGFVPSRESFSYTKTMILDLRPSNAQILKSFPSKTRYNISLSQKKNIVYSSKLFKELTKREQSAFADLHTKWSKDRHIIGFSNDFLFSVMSAFSDKGFLITARKKNVLVGAMLVLIHDGIGYYYYTCTNAEGMKDHVPTGLCFEAMMLAKSCGCEIFDFCSVYDERYPNVNARWKGFSEFKSRFHPQAVYYAPSYSRRLL